MSSAVAFALSAGVGAARHALQAFPSTRGQDRIKSMSYKRPLPLVAKPCKTHAMAEGAGMDPARDAAFDTTPTGEALCSSIKGVSWDSLQQSWVTVASFSSSKYGFQQAKQLAEQAGGMLNQPISSNATEEGRRLEKGSITEGSLVTSQPTDQPNGQSNDQPTAWAFKRSLLPSNDQPEESRSELQRESHQSGHAGVTWDGDNQRWVACWLGMGNRSMRVATFSAISNEFQEAKQMAIDACCLAENRLKGRQEAVCTARPDVPQYYSEVEGVSFDGRGLGGRWLAEWQTRDGDRVRVSFSVRAYGHREAKWLAERARMDADKHAGTTPGGE